MDIIRIESIKKIRLEKISNGMSFEVKKEKQMKSKMKNKILLSN